MIVNGGSNGGNRDEIGKGGLPIKSFNEVSFPKRPIEEIRDFSGLTERVLNEIMELLRFPESLKNSNENPERVINLSRVISNPKIEDKIIAELIEANLGGINTIEELIKIFFQLDKIKGIKDLFLCLVSQNNEQKLSKNSLYARQIEVLKRAIPNFFEISEDEDTDLPERDNILDIEVAIEGNMSGRVLFGFNGDNSKLGRLKRGFKILTGREFDVNQGLDKIRKTFLERFIWILEQDRKIVRKNFDETTSLPNLGFLQRSLEELGKNKVGIIRIDIDSFIDFKSALGEKSGQRILQFFAAVLFKVINSYNSINGTRGVPYRIGENNFIIIVPGLEEESELKKLYNQIQKEFEKHLLKLNNGDLIDIPFSAGTHLHVPIPGIGVEEGIVSANNKKEQNGENLIGTIKGKDVEIESIIGGLNEIKKRDIIGKNAFELKNKILKFAKIVDKLILDIDNLSESLLVLSLQNIESKINKIDIETKIHGNPSVILKECKQDISNYENIVNEVVKLLENFDIEEGIEIEKINDFKIQISDLKGFIEIFREAIVRFKNSFSNGTAELINKASIDVEEYVNLYTDKENDEIIDSLNNLKELAKELGEKIEKIGAIFKNFSESLNISSLIKMDGTFGKSNAIDLLNRIGILSDDDYMKLLTQD